MHDLHKTICDQLNATNLKYKNLADKHRHVQNFKIGDYVMVRLRPERFPSGTSQKLQARSAGPFEVLSRVGSNAYVVDLPADWGISSTFNVEDLMRFKGSTYIPSDPFE